MKKTILTCAFAFLLLIFSVSTNAKNVDCELDIEKHTFSGLYIGMSEENIRTRFEGKVTNTNWPDEAQTTAIAVEFSCGSTAITEIQKGKVSRVLISGAASARTGSKSVSIGSTFDVVMRAIPGANVHWGLAEGPYISVSTQRGHVVFIFDVEKNLVDKADRSPSKARKLFSKALLTQFLVR